MTPTYYQILELSEQASADDIRRAYLRLVRLTHPDRTPDPAAHRRYLLVNEAYDALRQPEQRARYDAHLQAQRQPPRPQYTTPFAGNAYQVLRVPYSATPAQIEQAYQQRRRILRRSPAADPAIQHQLAALEHAYATLHDPELRRLHHEHLRTNAAPTLSAEAAFYARNAPKARLLCRLLMVFAAALLLDFLWVRDLPRAVVVASELRTVQDRRGVVDSYYYLQTSDVGPDATYQKANIRGFRANGTYPAGTSLHLRCGALSGLVHSYQPSGTLASAAESYAGGWLPRIIAVLALGFGMLAGWAQRRVSSPKLVCDVAATAALFAVLALYLLLRLQH